MPAGRDRASGWIAHFASLLGPGATVLDLACGGGRHARFFAARGCRVTAVDRDVSGIADLGDDPGVEIVAADLEADPWPLSGRRFAAVVVTNYLHRPLFPSLRRSVAPGGLLLYETFAAGNEAFGRPGNPDFLLRAGELLALAGDELAVVAYEHGRIERDRPAVVQRLCATRGPASVVPLVPDQAKARRGAAGSAPA